MPKKKIDIDITEELDFLEKHLRKLSGRLKQDRFKTIIYIKKGEYSYQSDIAKKLGRGKKLFVRGYRIIQRMGCLSYWK